MHCPRLKHFVRLNANGTIGKCGHMINGKGFDSFEALEKSEWLKGLEDKMALDQWPDECTRCRRTEEISGTSIRLSSIRRHNILKSQPDYLVVGGVLDNVCNSACQTCHSGLSTKIGSLEGKDYPRVDNYVRFWELPLNRIAEVDVNGGEPTASKNYKKMLANLPRNTKIVRMNTNGSRMIDKLEDILAKNIMVIVTLSLDGVGAIHDYVRWPIKWMNYNENIDRYIELRKQYPLLKLNTWTTLSCLNAGDLPNILDYTNTKNLDHDWAFLNSPTVFHVKYKNRFTEKAKEVLDASSYSVCKRIAKSVCTHDDNDNDLMQHIKKQDSLRKIKFVDYTL